MNRAMYHGTIFAFTSYTQAARAQSLLESRNIRATVRRLPRTSESGCGYGVAVRGRGEEAEAILRDRGFRFRRMEGESR